MKFLIFFVFIGANYTLAIAQSTEPKSNDTTESIDPSAFEIAEPAEYIGGEEALMNFLVQETKYPRKARRKNVEGKVMVEFVVNRDGQVENVRTLGDKFGYGLEEEAIRVITATSGNWKPASVKGKPARMRFRIPILFQLED